MIMKANKQIGFIYKDSESIDKIIKDGDVVFERGFLRERTSTTLPITFGGVGKDLKDYRVYGNTYQNSTTGKNLRYIKDGTAAGVSLTYDNKSGKISIRGTATRTDGILLSEGGEVNIPAGTYTLSVSQPLPVLINSVVSLSSSTNVAFRMPAGNTSVTVNVPSDGVLVGLYFAVTNGTTYNFDFYLQLEEGSQATQFEPYTGGQPSPNPDYPQEIVSCGDRTKNLLNVPSTYTVERTNIDYSLQPGTYIVSCESPENYRRLLFFRWKENINNGDYVYIEANTTSTEFTITKEVSKLNFYSRDGASASTGNTSTYKNLMIRKSNISDDTYEPYGKYKIPVNVNNVITNIYLDEPLRGIDEYSDFIDFINGKVVRQLGEVILDENSALSVIEIITSNNKFIWRYTTALDIIGSGARSNILSNNYIGDTTVYSANNKIGAYVNSNGITNFATLLSTVGATTNSTITQVLNLLKTWLSLHHTELIYPLATPTEESITLPNIPTIDGNNTLNIETEITPSQVYIKYKSNT